MSDKERKGTIDIAGINFTLESDNSKPFDISYMTGRPTSSNNNSNNAGGDNNTRRND